MNRTIGKFFGVFVLLFLVILAFYQANTGQHFPAWASILPAIFAISLALLFGQVISSLLIGVLVGGVLSALQANAPDASLVVSGVTQTAGFITTTLADSWNLQVIIFLVAILISVNIMIVSQGLKGILNVIAPYAKSARSAQFVTYLMGLLVFIDDYANTVLVGSSMRPIMDKYRVSREKLAFIVDSTSAPVSGIAFISTWIGYEVGQMGQVAKGLGLPQDGYSIFFDIVLFRYYCLFMLCFVAVNILSRREFGPMRIAEEKAKQGISLNEDLTEDNPAEGVRISIWSALLPIITLFAYFLVALWLDGGGGNFFIENPLNVFSPMVWRAVVAGSTHNMTLLMQAGLLCFIVGTGCAFCLAKVRLKNYGKAFLQGLRSAWLPIVILVLAWSLKNASDSLHADVYLVSLIGENIPAWLFPLTVFVLSALTAIATGTSWGTMAILIPMVMPIGLSFDGGYGLITMLSLAAVLDGSIFGDHCSPISDTTLMSSISTSCNHVKHVITQFPYAFFVALLAMFVGYLPQVLGAPVWFSLVLGVLVIFSLFYVVLPLLQGEHKA